MSEPARHEGRPLWSRRAVVGTSLAGLTIVFKERARAAVPIDLTYRAGRLFWPMGSTRAAIGKGGVRTAKREGDLATPAGDFALLQGFYRADRVKPPLTTLQMRTLEPNDAWVDDPRDADYNRLVHLPYPSHVERLWRQDEIYDLLVVVGYNLSPTVAGAGSAIFLHIARKTFSPTVGCVAIERSAFLRILPMLGPDSRLKIEA
jgi:L,D-peptidoglycan transpeptidase YkuD (ErfK/YbiS/YcfS/YnhG family)